MDREQAKEILSAARPGETAPEGDVLFAEALALMEQDPELAEWFAEQTAIDSGMRDALRAVEPPAHLREAILSTQKVAEFPTAKTRRGFPAWLAMAAAVVVLAVGAAIFLPQGGSRLDVAALDAAIPKLTDKHGHSFGSKTGNIDEVRAWLAANGGVKDLAVPAGLQGRGAVGCEVASIEGKKVSILCFHMGEGRTAHLYVVDTSDLRQAPPAGVPAYSQQGAYAVASWSTGGQSYFLAQRGDVAGLEKLL